jgi:hypothetical protein
LIYLAFNSVFVHIVQILIQTSSPSLCRCVHRIRSGCIAHYQVILVPHMPAKARRSMEWPPTPWALRVFSSRTCQWEERAFVREGMPAGIVDKMRLDPETPYGTRWRYAVYHHGSLYVRCRGSFVTRYALIFVFSPSYMTAKHSCVCR